MEQGSYWSRVAGNRLSRRRLIAAGGMLGLSAAAASLMGCGSDGDDGGKGQSLVREGKGLLATAEDSTARVKRGGTLRDFITGDYPTFDPLSNNNNPLSSMTQSRLVMGLSTRFDPYDGAIQGDLADSWETTPDGLQWTWKLRPNAVFPELPGGVKRNVDSQDILFNYNRYLAVGEYRGALANSISPAGPVTSISAPDARTVVMKLSFPAPMAQIFQEHLYMVPREADGKYDPRGQILGSGPWVVEKYEPSAFIHYKRHPEWHFKDRPFLDRVERPILTDYATRLAQFKAHRIHSGVVNQDQIIQTKKDVPELNLYATGFPTVGYTFLVLGLARPSQPFKDERVRRAISMAIDRGELIDVFSNVTKFQQEGLEVGVRWDTHLGRSPVKFWLDPLGKDFGEHAKWFKFDPAEAKKLAAAAGAGPGYKTTHSRAPAALNVQLSAAIEQVKQNLSWEIQDVVLQAQGGPTVSILDQKGDFDGMTWTSYTHKPDPTLYLYHKYHSNGSSLRVPQNLDPQMDKMFDELFRERDDKKKVTEWQDMQRYLANKMYLVPIAGSGEQFTLAWPELKNFGVFNLSAFDVDGTERIAWNYWLDQA